MKLLRLSLALTITIFFSQACKTTKNSSSKVGSSTSQIFVFQNGEETVVNGPTETVEIDDEKFSLRFYNKRYTPEDGGFYSTQIAAFLNEEQLDKIKVGMSKSDFAFFAPGSGMAPDRSGKHETLIIKENGHHYTFYENAESKRLNLIEEEGELLKLEFDIAGLYYDNKNVAMNEITLEEFYLAVLIDRNQNGIIEEDELWKLTLAIN